MTGTQEVSQIVSLTALGGRFDRVCYWKIIKVMKTIFCYMACDYPEYSVKGLKNVFLVI